MNEDWAVTLQLWVKKFIHIDKLLNAWTVSQIHNMNSLIHEKKLEKKM